MIYEFTKRPKTESLDVVEYYNIKHLKQLSQVEDFTFLDNDEKEEAGMKIDAIPIYISKILKALKNGNCLKRTLVQKNSVGRYYYQKKDNFGVLYLKNAVRGYILKEGTLDLDVKNCHPTLLLSLFKSEGLLCDELNQYVTDRDKTMISHKFDKETFLVMINDKNFKSSNPFLNKLHSTIYDKFIPIMIKKHDLFYKQCKLIDSKSKNVDGTFISRLLQEAEQDVMFYCMEFLTSKKIPFGCLIYDGIHLYDDISTKTIGSLSDYVELKTGYPVKFSIKQFPKQDIIKEFVKDIEVREETTYENDAVTELFEKYKKRIKYYNESLYLKDSDYMWHVNEKQISNILIRWMLDIDSRVKINKMEGIKKIFLARASDTFNDPDLKRKFDISTKNKLCFKNGYIDFITKTFISWKDADENIFTDLTIQYDYEPSEESSRKLIFDRILYPIFDNNEKMLEEFLFYCSRALGMNKDKYWLSTEGERDSGKGVLNSLFKCAFGPYIFEFASSNLTLRKNFEAEIRNTWAEPFVKSRLGFCHETSELSDDGHSQQKLDGTKIKKIASGGDEIQIKLMRENTKSESIRASLVMFQNTLLTCSPADAMKNMLVMRFPCYFSDSKRDMEFAKYRPCDKDIKMWIEEEKLLRSAFVDIVVDYFHDKTPKYQIFKETADKLKEVEVADDYDQKISEIFKITCSNEDFISSEDVTRILNNNNIKMSASKFKQRVERFGAEYGVYRIDGRTIRGYKKIKTLAVTL